MRIVQEPKYKLIINTDSYTGNFERGCIGYVLGILDEVQMNIDHSLEYRKAFREEEKLTEVDSYDLLGEYLFERYQDVDDWEQMTFYDITTDGGAECNSIEIFIGELLTTEWQERIERRLVRFFGGEYQRIENESWIAQFGEPHYEQKWPKLLSLRLIQGDQELWRKTYE